MTAGGASKATLGDRLKVWALVAMRRHHHRTLHETSVRSFRRRVVPTSPAPRPVPAARRYRKRGWIPAGLMAVKSLPREARLPKRYLADYYLLGKLVWRAYNGRPIDPALVWDPDSAWNDAFPKGRIEWGDPTDEDTFVRLRLQGPNPFMLRAVGDGDGDDDIDEFELDFGPVFDGLFPPTVARFAIDTENEPGLRATSITIGDTIYRADGDHDRWDRAKRVVNALDARYAAFVRHLLNTHLMVGQAYAVSAYTLPPWHPLRPFLDFFTYGTLQVNHYAYGALLSPDSYFIRSNFVTMADANRLISNAMTEFDFGGWHAERDIADRGIDRIPDHPYVADARATWEIIDRFVARHLDDLDITDTEVADDPDLAGWYATLRQALPKGGIISQLQTRADLEWLLVALVYNNVIHEVCGNLAPILDSRHPDDKVAVNFANLRRSVALDTRPEPPAAAEVLLMDQAAYVSSFNVAGNNLLTIRAARYIDDPRLRQAIEDLQDALGELDTQLTERNAGRAIAFHGMQPSNWEASVSF